VQKPALVIAHNKTLAAQLCNEFREFFPQNAVEYFVSYYDYYQPEAYVPQADLYIEKDARSTTTSTGSATPRRRAPHAPRRRHRRLGVVHLRHRLAEEYEQDRRPRRSARRSTATSMLRKLVDIQYSRNDSFLGRGRFRVTGDVVEVQPAHMEIGLPRLALRRRGRADHALRPALGRDLRPPRAPGHLPGDAVRHSKDTIERSVGEIRHELEEQVKLFESQGKLLEAHRIRQRTEYDLEMLQELGYCNGIENYSRILDGARPGPPPHTLLDYFPATSSSSSTSRTRPCRRSAACTRATARASRRSSTSASGFPRRSTTGRSASTSSSKACRSSSSSRRRRAVRAPHSTNVAEQIIRRPGSSTRGRAAADEEPDRRPAERDPPARGGGRARPRHDADEEDGRGPDRLPARVGVKARYLHSEIDTLERIQIIRELRLGEYDVLVGVNLLREGLDLPEVSLVAILDADKEGFLRGQTALVQTIGRAARNVNGKVVMYADKMTEAIKGALDETNRRRDIQLRYNEEHGITPESIVKGVSDIAEFLAWSRRRSRAGARRGAQGRGHAADEIEKLVVTLEEEMFAAAEELRFEYAAKLRDEIKELRRELQAATPEPAA
jgi:excinuclease ABC subunit B